MRIIYIFFTVDRIVMIVSHLVDHKVRDQMKKIRMQDFQQRPVRRFVNQNINNFLQQEDNDYLPAGPRLVRRPVRAAMVHQDDSY